MKKIVFFLIVIVALFFIFNKCSNNSSTYYDQQNVEDFSNNNVSSTKEVKSYASNKDMANESYITVKEIVKKKLKSPSTANFPTFDFVYENLGNNLHKIIGYVDSQNSFGATIRTYYKLTLRYNGRDWTDINNWEIISEEYE